MFLGFFGEKKRLCLVVSKSCGAFGVVISCFFFELPCKFVLNVMTTSFRFKGFRVISFIKGTLK